MAEITLKKLAEQSYHLQASKNGATGEKVNLKEVAGSTLLPYIVDKSLFNLICEKNQILGADEIGLKVVKNQATTWTEKTEKAGTGESTKWRVSKPTTIEWHQVLKTFEAYTAIEKQMADKAISTSAKISQALTDFSRIFEKTSFEKLENKIIEENLKTEQDLLKLKGFEARKLLVQKATELTETVDPEQGIDLISPEDIVIFVKPQILDHIVDSAITGDRANISFTNGQYSVTHVGGYKIISNPFLKEFEAIITTNFAASSAQKIIALNAGKVDNLSEDEGVYIEATFASEIVWNKLAHGFYKQGKAENKKEVKIETPDLQDAA